MPSQKQPGEIFPYWSVPCRGDTRTVQGGRSGQTMLCVSDDWQFVRASLTPQSRAEGAQALRAAVAFVAQRPWPKVRRSLKTR
jgi:hypothetical protein